MVLQEQVELQVLQELQDPQVLQVLRVLQELQEQVVHQELRVLQELLV